MSRAKLRQMISKKQNVAKSSSNISKNEYRTNYRLDNDEEQLRKKRYENSDSDEVIVTKRRNDRNKEEKKEEREDKRRNIREDERRNEREEELKDEREETNEPEDENITQEKSKDQDDNKQEENLITYLEENNTDEKILDITSKQDKNDSDVSDSENEKIGEKAEYKKRATEDENKQDSYTKKNNRQVYYEQEELQQKKTSRHKEEEDDSYPKRNNRRRYEEEEEPRQKKTNKSKEESPQKRSNRRRYEDEDDEDEDNLSIVEENKIRFVTNDEDEPKRKSNKDYYEDTEDMNLENKPFDHIPKNVIVRYLKQLSSNSGADTVQAVLIILNELVYNFFFKVLSKKEDNIITMRDVKDLISIYIDEDNLPDDIFIPSKTFEQGIRLVCEESKCVLKRDGVTYTQLFTEYLITKIVGNAYLIAKNAKRNRISGKDILLAYKLAMF